MTDKLPSVKPAELVRALERCGWYVKRQTGSHAILVNEESKKAVPVPMHSRDLRTGTLHGIIKRAGISAVELRRLL